MTKDFLSEIVAHKKSLLEKKKAFFHEWQSDLKRTRMTRYRVFKNEISKPGRINLIAEVKKASPSKGLIRKDFHALELAKVYSENGADALSVLTEEKYFLGKLTYVQAIAATCPLPVLMKDFIIDAGQIYEAFYYGASAVLLIVAILDDALLTGLMQTAHQMDMDCLVEVHNPEELQRALSAGAEIIGVNNRDLRTFEVDMTVCERLIPMIPQDKIVVAESGLTTHADIRKVQMLGARAVLIGETFMRAKDIGGKIRELMGTRTA